MNVEDLYRLLRTSHVQAQGIIDTVPDPLLVLDESLLVQSASRSFFETFRVSRYETIGQHVYELGNGQWDIPELRQLLADVLPKSAAVVDFRVDHDFPDLGRRTMLLTARKLFHPDNASHSLLLSMVDVTENVRRDAAKDMLFGELRHRMKNLLAVTQSLARQTTTEGRSAQEYRDVFLGRFSALIEAQEVAFAETGSARLTDAVQRLLSPFVADTSTIEIEPGPDAVLEPRIVLSLGLILHELATNAAKYGALSTSGGRVSLSWRIEESGGKLRLSWVESGGPPVTPPERTGAGTHLIRSAATFGLGGDLEQTYAASGLKAELVIPLGSASAAS